MDIPEMAKGTVIPAGVQQKILEEAREAERLKAQRRHDFVIATYGIIGGLISGVLSSLIVLWLSGSL